MPLRETVEPVLKKPETQRPESKTELILSQDIVDNIYTNLRLGEIPIERLICLYPEHWENNIKHYIIESLLLRETIKLRYEQQLVLYQHLLANQKRP